MNKKFGFTLAEVLITLAIIGVVAALTIPTLTSNYRKKEVETKLQKFYATMQQAIKMSTVDNGPTEGWTFFGSSNTTNATYEDVLSWFNKYLAPYLNYSGVKKSANGKSLIVQFQNGSLLLISPSISDMIFYTNDCLSNNTCKKGVSYFNFLFHPQSIPSDMYSQSSKYVKSPNIQTYSYAWDGTIEGAKYSTIESYYGCYQNSAALCSKLIQLNGWKIPDDYPYHF